MRRGRGRPRNTYFQDFSVRPEGELYVVQFRLGGATPLVTVIVRPKRVALPKKLLNPHQAFYEVVNTLRQGHDPISPGSGTVDAIARRLTAEFRKQRRAIKRM
jgi:hypothetical protein